MGLDVYILQPTRIKVDLSKKIIDGYKETSGVMLFTYNGLSLEEKNIRLDELFEKYSSYVVEYVNDRYLLMNVIRSFRGGDKKVYYTSFYGDCWYKVENSGLKIKDIRHFVFYEERNEFLEHFKKDAYIQLTKIEHYQLYYLWA